MQQAVRCDLILYNNFKSKKFFHSEKHEYMETN